MALELPTVEQLEQLLEEKGRDALVWYAWRNALRALPLLGCVPLTRIWAEDTLKSSIAICRIPLLLALYGKSETNKTADFFDKAIDLAGEAIDLAYMDIHYASMTDNKSYFTEIDDIVSVVHFIAYSAAVTVTANFTEEDDNFYTIIKAAHNSYHTFDTYVAEPEFYNATKVDYIFLKNLNKSNDYWFSQPLWPYSKNNNASIKPIFFDKYCMEISRKLIDLGLGFLAKDLNRLWEYKSNPFQPHWNNYAKNLSKQNLKTAESYREAILGESANINAVRILLLGAGGAGKTTLAERLQNKPITATNSCNKTTIGIDYLEHQPLLLIGEKSAFLCLSIPENLQLYLWDFGGQTLFHGLHKSFLHENCVYVLVVDSRHEQAPDEWLQQIQHLIGDKPTPPILIVNNEYENCYQQQNEQRLQREFPNANLQFFSFPCNRNDHQGLQQFKRSLLNTANQAHYTVGQSLFNVTEQVDKLFKKKVVVDILELEEKLEDYISYDMKIIISQLEGLGRIINIEGNENEDERYCLNPTWVVDHAYHLLSLECLRKSDGTITSQILKKSAKRYFTNKKKNQETNQPELNNRNINDLLKFLQKSRVCKSLQGKRLFFPNLAAANEPKKIQKILQNKAESPSLVEFHLPYLPISLAAYLVCRWLENNENNQVIIKSTDDVWREGFILSHQQCDNSYLIVQYQPHKAVLLVYCFGDKVALSDLLNAIWQGLIKEIKPIRAEQVLVFVGLDRNVSGFDFRRDKIILSKKSDNLSYSDFFKILGENMNSGNIVINGNVSHSQISKGDNNNLTQNLSDGIKVTGENRAELAKEAIKNIRNEYDLSGRQSYELAGIELQIEENTVNDDFYHKLRINLGTVADIVTISTAIASMVGLIL